MHRIVKSLLLIAAISLSCFGAFAGDAPPAGYKLKHCVSPTSPTDVIAVDYDRDGNAIEYKRNKEDIGKVIARLKEKIKDDPGITKSKHWKAEMLTSDYWMYTLCGGTKDCGSKSCSGNSSCYYGNVGMAGCRCS